MSAVLRSIWDGLAGGSWLDQVNLGLGITGVWLMVKRSLWAFPVGLVAVTVQGVLFFRTRIYADAALQLFFFVALAWGWWHWVRDRGDASELPVTTMPGRERVMVIVVTVAATVGWALAARRWTNSLMPWRDAAIAMLQVAGQMLQARKKLENWAFFTVANAIAIPAYWSAELAYTAFLFGLYLVLGLLGWRAWARAKKAQNGAPAKP
ncbi:MAG: nicotinamide mononucleotide transporter [Verrucomicrobia bacterium]|nr:nicotinamide mononucleotide transporter [Verrucomicrobiota bacterium]